jgi:hypothetical protein
MVPRCLLESGAQPSFGSNAVVVVGPGEEFAEAAAFAPQKKKETRRAGRLGLGTKECFHAPAQVRTLPRSQAIAPRRFPIIPKHAHHRSVSSLPRV